MRMLPVFSLAAISMSFIPVQALERPYEQQIAQTAKEEQDDSAAPAEGAPESEPGAPENKTEQPPRKKDREGERPPRAERNGAEGGKPQGERPARRERKPDPAAKAGEAPPMSSEEPSQQPAKKAAPPPADPPSTKEEVAPPEQKSEPRSTGQPEPAPKEAAPLAPEAKEAEQPSPRGERPPRTEPTQPAGGAPAAPSPPAKPPEAPLDDKGASAPPAKQPKSAEPAAPAVAPSQVKDLKELKAERKQRKEDGGKRVIIEEPDKRVIVKEGDKTIIRADETERFRRLGGKSRQEKRNGLDITINISPDGLEIFTEMDDRGRPLRRYRRDRDGRETMLFDNRDYYRRHRDGSFVDAIIDLPPPRVTIPRNSYVVDYEEASDMDVYDALSAEPIEQLDRAYSLEEVRRSPSLRDRMRRIDLDTINFSFGAWDVAPSQYPALERIANAMNRVVDRNPNEMFLIEGHTDAVGSDDDNLSLSDRRAETVAIVLTEEFGVPPENLVTQGYGEQYLKIATQQPEVQNRRVAVRRITPLISRAN